jgi:hypothetical protein
LFKLVIGFFDLLLQIQAIRFRLGRFQLLLQFIELPALAGQRLLDLVEPFGRFLMLRCDLLVVTAFR